MSNPVDKNGIWPGASTESIETIEHNECGAPSEYLTTKRFRRVINELRAALAERDALQRELDKVVSSMPSGSPEFMRAMAASAEERFARKLSRK